MESPQISRRRLLKTIFCSSMAMGLNLERGAAATESSTSGGTLDLFALGDFGTGNEHQRKVGRQMASYAQGLGKKPEALLMLGDNFYGPMPGGVECNRWQRDFSEVYPASEFPGPCYAILGNHDYHDHPGNVVELEYAKKPGGTRWTMPHHYYRLDLPAENPQVTLLMIDTDWKTINSRIHGEGPCWMEEDERVKQMLWLKEQLASKRAKFTVVAGHHPVYSESNHGDTQELVSDLAPLLQEHGVHIYLCGHDHDLQHLELDGQKTSFVLSGGGGQELSGHHELRPGSSVFQVHGFTHLSLAGDSITIRHINSNGEVVHAFVKNADYSWKALS